MASTADLFSPRISQTRSMGISRIGTANAGVFAPRGKRFGRSISGGTRLAVAGLSPAESNIALLE